MTVIDGHNLYFALDRVDEDHFERGLERLVKELKGSIRRQSNILVLDGSGGGDPRGREQKLSEHLRLVYSGNTMKADDWIERWMLRTRLPSWELVTADLKLYERLRYKGLRRLDPVTWYAKLKRSPGDPRRQGARSRQQLKDQGGKKTFGQVDEWLDYFGESEGS